MSTFPKKTNLESFLFSVTPIFSSNKLIKEEINNLEKHECFRLEDFWNCFEECSAYGVAVPITLQNGEQFMQHFAPYLSAIQIFTRNSSANSIRGDKKGEGSTSSGSLSDSSNGSTEKPWEGRSSSHESIRDYRNLKPLNDRLGSPYLQYIEFNAPYIRLPFKDQIDMLAKDYSGLKSLRSIDLSPASWVSIAWYPIYSIPLGRRHKDLSTCFLTYHTLSQCYQGADLKTRGTEGAEGKEIEEGTQSSIKLKRKEGEDLPLPPFGLVSHKMYGDLWLSDMNAKDQERLVMMWSAADSWLKQLGVHHHDFNFFTDNRRI